jgi:hypothetical protein
MSPQEEQIKVLEVDVSTSKEMVAENEMKLVMLKEKHQEYSISNEFLHTKLLECKDQLKANEQMIRWLNGQVWSPGVFQCLHLAFMCLSYTTSSHVQITARHISGKEGASSSSCQVQERMRGPQNHFA